MTQVRTRNNPAVVPACGRTWPWYARRRTRVQVLTAGFTILEMLIVIAIIGILASIVLYAINDSRTEARNAQVISQVYEYQKALNLYFAETGEYPTGHNPITRGNIGLRRQIWCQGTGARPGACIPFGQSGSFGAVSDFEFSLSPDYISEIVHIEQNDTSIYEISSPAYRGCSNLVTGVGNHQSTGTDEECGTDDYSIFFTLEGANQDCGRAHQVSPDYNSEGITICQLSSAQ